MYTGVGGGGEAGPVGRLFLPKTWLRKKVDSKKTDHFGYVFDRG